MVYFMWGFPHKILIEHKGEIIAVKITQQAKKVADELDKEEVEIEPLNSPKEDVNQKRQSTAQQIKIGTQLTVPNSLSLHPPPPATLFFLSLFSYGH